MTVNKERIELWCQALESEGYKQCKGSLKKTPLLEPVMHCAEGVAMEVAQRNGVKIYLVEWVHDASMPKRVRDWYGLDSTPMVKRPAAYSKPLIHSMLCLYGFPYSSRSSMASPHKDSLDAAWAEVEETLWGEAMELREEYGKPYKHSIEWINGFEYAAGRVTWLRKDINDSEYSWPFDSETEAT